MCPALVERTENRQNIAKMQYKFITIYYPSDTKYCFCWLEQIQSKIRQDLSFPTLAAKKISRPSGGGGGGGGGVCPKKNLLNFWNRAVSQKKLLNFWIPI